VGKPSGAKARSSWQYQTLLVFLSPCTQRVLHQTSASPHEVTLVLDTLEQSLVEERPEHLIGDKAYDSDKLDEQLAGQDIEMIAPHCKNRKPENKTQDGRPLRRYKRRWKVERLFAWLQNFRRVLTRFDFYPENYLGFVHLACIKILLKCYL
jgi:transposase